MPVYLFLLLCWLNMTEARWNNKTLTRPCPFGLCEEVEDYPQEKIQVLLGKNPTLRKYFDLSPLLPGAFENRNNFDQEESLCSVKTHTTFPKSARNTKNVEQKIVNVQNHMQGIVFETCSQSEDKECRFSEAFPQGFSSKCKQKFAIRRLMVVDGDSLTFDNFEIPSCCVCVLKKN